MNRSGRLTSRTRVGQVSRRRIRAGGPLALGRPSATLEAWREIRAEILARARWRCQACGLPTYRLEVHHIQKRAQGGSDFDRDFLIALCCDCHARTDAPFRQGRLVITPLGAGRFDCEVRHGSSKWSVQQDGRDAAGAPPGPVPPKVADGDATGHAGKAAARHEPAAPAGRTERKTSTQSM